jgi:multidrug efflux system membrane fusion protein
VKALDEDNRVIFYPVQIVEDTAGGMWVGGLPYQITLITVGHAFVDEGVIVDPVPADQTARSDADILSGEQT